MAIGFTGTSLGMTSAQLIKARQVIHRLSFHRVVHHGDCVGADAEVHEMSLELGLDVVLHPPSNDIKRALCTGYCECREPLPYLQRNRCIVDESTVLIAAPKTEAEELRSGTWSTVRYARKSSRRVVLLLPDGRVVTEGG